MAIKTRAHARAQSKPNRSAERQHTNRLAEIEDMDLRPALSSSVLLVLLLLVPVSANASSKVRSVLSTESECSSTSY
jgi:hypothetical protein